LREPHMFEASENCLKCKFRKTTFFCGLDSPALKDFDVIKTLAVYPSNALLFIEKENPRGVFVLCEGQVKLSMASRDGRTLVLRFAKPGEVLGLTAVVAGIPYEVTAEALTASQLAFVRKNDFLKFLEHHPGSYEAISKYLVSVYASACNQLRSVGLSPIPKRLARLLLDWSEEAGREEKVDCRIMMRLTHEEIGEFIGSTRETVTRTLGDFETRRIISLRDGSVTINDRKTLEAMAAA